MDKQEYEKYLKSKHWKTKKKEYKASNRIKKCLVCGNKKYVLHHKNYENLYNESLDDLLPLCEDHHNRLHREINEGQYTFNNSYKTILSWYEKKNKIKFNRESLFDGGSKKATEGFKKIKKRKYGPNSNKFNRFRNKKTGTELGNICRNCEEADLVLRKTMKMKLTKKYNFTHYIWCWNCNARFYKEEFKQLNKKL